MINQAAQQDLIRHYIVCACWQDRGMKIPRRRGHGPSQFISETEVGLNNAYALITLWFFICFVVILFVRVFAHKANTESTAFCPPIAYISRPTYLPHISSHPSISGLGPAHDHSWNGRQWHSVNMPTHVFVFIFLPYETGSIPVRSLIFAIDILSSWIVRPGHL